MNKPYKKKLFDYRKATGAYSESLYRYYKFMIDYVMKKVREENEQM